jgi:hypothetical protein
MKTELHLTVATAALAMANICPVSATALISTDSLTRAASITGGAVKKHILSIFQDTVTNGVIHFGGPGFKY